MKKTTEQLLKNFVDLRLRPNRTHHGEDGKTRFVWYVDDDDDRYVELVDSARGALVLVLWRDGYRVEACVRDPAVVIGDVQQYLHALGIRGGG